MADLVKENWRAKPMSASGALCAPGGKMGGFFCTTGGAVKITAGTASGGATIVDEFTAVAPNWYPMPFDLPEGAYVTLTDAIGTFAV